MFYIIYPSFIYVNINIHFFNIYINYFNYTVKYIDFKYSFLIYIPSCILYPLFHPISRAVNSNAAALPARHLLPKVIFSTPGFTSCNLTSEKIPKISACVFSTQKSREPVLLETRKNGFSGVLLASHLTRVQRNVKRHYEMFNRRHRLIRLLSPAAVQYIPCDLPVQAVCGDFPYPSSSRSLPDRIFQLPAVLP